MKGKTMSRKTTPQLFADALLELSKKKTVDKITIKEIADQCGLSSQTFYNHFSDKHALILWIHKSFGDELLKKLEKNDYSFRDFTIENLRFYSDHAAFMLNALENTQGQDSYWVRSSEYAIAALEKYIREHFSIKSLSEKERMHLRMFVYANTEAYAYWALNDMIIPLEKMADYIIEGMPETLKKYFVA